MSELPDSQQIQLILRSIKCWEMLIWRIFLFIRLNLKGIYSVTPQNRYLANYSNHATIRTMSLWKRPPSKMCMSQHTHYAGGIKVVTLHRLTMEPTKIYNITAKTPRVKIQIYIQRSKSYIKQNSIRVRTRVQMGLRGLKINDGVHNPAQAKPEG
jgi:hypothetical protein